MPVHLWHACLGRLRETCVPEAAALAPAVDHALLMVPGLSTDGEFPDSPSDDCLEKMVVASTLAQMLQVLRPIPLRETLTPLAYEASIHFVH